MIPANRLITQSCRFLVIFCFIFSVISLNCPAETNHLSVKTEESSVAFPLIQKKSIEYTHFNAAIIWGSFENMYWKFPITGFHVGNLETSNRTISVIGWVRADHRIVYQKSCDVDASLWIGFIGKHKLYVFAFGLISVG